ncbi:MAG: bifunctional pyr operon transcriptional regulator/uracil phosphoribosyltransferase PyrR [Verrucomicrobiota bacterium]
MGSGAPVWDEAKMGGEIQSLAHSLREACQDHEEVAFVGIHQRGVPLAERIAEEMGDLRPNAFGTLDISLYRDDFDNRGTIPKLRGSDIPFSPEGMHVILFDDVLFTGRTVRAAIDALMDYGRPSCIELAVLVDRGNRELPIQPDYCGGRLETGGSDYVRVRFREVDGEDAVYWDQSEEG